MTDQDLFDAQEAAKALMRDAGERDHWREQARLAELGRSRAEADLERMREDVRRIATLIAPLGLASGAERWRWAEAMREATKAGRP